MKIRRFDNRTIALYHGYGSSPSQYRKDFLSEVGFDDVISDYIDYDYEWKLDRCKSLFEREIKKCRNVDVIMGFSLGGYLSFKLSGVLSIDLMLVNPALDRDKTLLDIKHFDAPSEKNFKKVELFLGDEDTLIDKNITVGYLKKENIKFSQFIIRGMEHRTSPDDFVNILNKSSII